MELSFQSRYARFLDRSGDTIQTPGSGAPERGPGGFGSPASPGPAAGSDFDDETPF